MSFGIDGSDLRNALSNGLGYALLPPSLRQRLTEADYITHTVRHAILRGYGYHRLPDYAKVLRTEKGYYEEMISYSGQQLQLYPYRHQKSIVLYTRETPLTYYTRMVSELLKSEYSYDRLPNFTAVDVLYLLGIGRNQYLNLTKEVRSKLRWHINRNFVPEHLPNCFLESVKLNPFWRVEVMDQSVDSLRKLTTLLSPDALLLLNFLLSKGASVAQQQNSALSTLKINSSIVLNDTFFVCQLPRTLLLELFRYGLVFTSFTVTPEDCIVIPPLDGFVMNRTSDDPQEVLLYKVLSMADERTPMSLLAQLLLLSDEDVCTAAEILIRLSLAVLKNPPLPETIVVNTKATVHESWLEEVEGIVSRQQQAAKDSALVLGSEMNANGDHPTRRVAFLYDSTLTGFLMMTNLSKNPLFKQNAVTLFEVGRMASDVVNVFLELLDGIDSTETQSFGGEAQKYISSAFCLRLVLHALKDLTSPEDTDGQSSTVGADMLKIESLNELEPTTRYSVLGRNYWAYVITSPASCPPLIDMELSGVYGSTVSLMISPWFMLFLYVKTGQGPLSLLVPFGAQLHAFPPSFFRLEEPDKEDSPLGSVAKLRVRSMTLDAQVSYLDLDHSLLLVNDMAETAPVFLQCHSLSVLQKKKDGFIVEESPTAQRVLEVTIPFDLPSEEVKEMIQERVGDRFVVFAGGREGDLSRVMDLLTTSAAAIYVEHSLGYFVLSLTFRVVEQKEEKSAEEPSVLRLASCHVVDIGLGVPLTDLECCTRLVRQLPQRLTREEMDLHNASMQKCVGEFSEFLEKYTTLTRQVHGTLALQSSTNGGPMTQLHLRRTGISEGAPYPSTLVFFNGTELSIVDDLNPLSELW